MKKEKRNKKKLRILQSAAKKHQDSSPRAPKSVSRNCVVKFDSRNINVSDASRDNLLSMNRVHDLMTDEENIAKDPIFLLKNSLGKRKCAVYVPEWSNRGECEITAVLVCLSHFRRLRIYVLDERISDEKILRKVLLSAMFDSDHGERQSEYTLPSKEGVIEQMHDPVWNTFGKFKLF